MPEAPTGSAGNTIPSGWNTRRPTLLRVGKAHPSSRRTSVPVPLDHPVPPVPASAPPSPTRRVPLPAAQPSPARAQRQDDASPMVTNERVSRPSQRYARQRSPPRTTRAPPTPAPEPDAFPVPSPRRSAPTTPTRCRDSPPCKSVRERRVAATVEGHGAGGTEGES